VSSRYFGAPRRSLEDAAYRILEKIRVRNLYPEQLYTFGGPNRDRVKRSTVTGAVFIGELLCASGFYEAELVTNGAVG